LCQTNITRTLIIALDPNEFKSILIAYVHTHTHTHILYEAFRRHELNGLGGGDEGIAVHNTLGHNFIHILRGRRRHEVLRALYDVVESEHAARWMPW
jgi:hypothetical protein